MSSSDLVYAAMRPARCIDEFMWDMVVFKVEDRIFRVNRHAFIESSVVFESMFMLPSGSCTDSPEGKTIDRPIVLEGQKKSDFAALLKVLYPKYVDIIEGRLNLEKDEWVGVLKLSTMWAMNKIRQFSIATLSNAKAIALNAVEKVNLAREHRVGKWFVEGIIALTFGAHPQSAPALREAVGLETAYEILAIQAKYSLLGRFTNHSRGLAFSLSDINCRHCFGQVLDKPLRCAGLCDRELLLDGKPNVYVLRETAMLRSDDSKMGLWFRSAACGCLECGRQVMSRPGIYCHSCGEDCGNGELFVGPSRRSVEDEIRRVFQVEIGSYRW